MAVVRADVERFCAELVEVAIRLAELRVTLEGVVAAAPAQAMADARDGGLRRIGRQVGMSHEQVRRMPAERPSAPGRS